MPKPPETEAAIGRGLAFLAKRQETDGSFVSFSSASMQPFRRLRSWQTTFVPALMLASLSGSDSPQAMDIRRRLAGFLLEQRDADWSFNYWSKNAPEYRTMPYPNDLDDTFCALTALYLHDPALIDETALARIIKLLLATETAVGGPYRTWLVAPDSEPVWLDVDVAVNSNIAYFLSLVSDRLPRLDDLMGQAIVSDTYESPYYPSAYAFVYYFARAYGGPRKDRLLRKIRRLQAEAGTDLDRALCLNARLRLGDRQGLDETVQELLDGQRRDGSWPAAAFYADPVKDGKEYYNGGPALSTAFAVEALGLYARAAGTGQEQASAAGPRTGAASAVVLSLAKRRSRGIPTDLRRTTLESLAKLAESRDGAEIIGLPEMFNRSLRQPLRPAEGFMEDLSLANLYGWLAYTIYDDFLDEEGRPGLLPAANLAMREALRGFLEAVPDNHKLVRDTFNTIDGANAWELAHCRFACRGGRITVAALPDYGDLSKLAERSLGHALAPLAILSGLGRPLEDTREALTHYLIVRQLNDDLHDWQEDLGNGHATYVVCRILKGLRIKPGDYDLRDLTNRAGRQFWYKTLPAICRDMQRHISRSRKALNQAGIYNGQGGLYRLLDTLEASLRDTLAKQSQARNFLQQYQGEEAKV